MSKDNFKLNLKNLNNKTKRSKSKDSDGINLKEIAEEKLFKTNKSNKTLLKKINELAKAMDSKETRINMLELKAKQQEEKWEALVIGLKKQQVMNQILLTNLKKTMETQKIIADLPSFNKKDTEKNNYFFLKKNNYLINNLIEAYEKNVLENNLNSNLNSNLNLNSENNLAPNFNDSNSNSNLNLSLVEGMPGAGGSGSKSKISIEGDEEENKTDVIGDEWLEFIDDTILKNNVYNNKIELALKEKLNFMKKEIENKWWSTITELFQNSINQINAIPNQFNINNKNLQNIINTHCETIINNNINIKEIEDMVNKNLKEYEENLRIENEKHMKFNKNIQEKLDMIDENIKNNMINFNNKINEINQQKQGLIEVQKMIEERYNQLINENKFHNIESDVNRIKNLIEKADETSRTKFIEFENNFQRDQTNIIANNDKITNLKLDIQNFNLKYDWINNQINNLRTELSIINNNNNNIFTTQKRVVENNNNFNNNQVNSNIISINNENSFYSKSEINNTLINYVKKQEWKNDLEEIKNSINGIKVMIGNQKMELNKEINEKIEEMKIEEEIFKKNIGELKTWKLQNIAKIEDMNLIIENIEIEIKNYKKSNNNSSREEITSLVKNQISRTYMNIENIIDQKIQEKRSKEIKENSIMLKKFINTEIKKEIKNTKEESDIQLNLVKDNKEIIEEKKIIWCNKENKNDVISKIRTEIESKVEELKLWIEENNKKIDIKFKKESDQIINKKIINLIEEMDNQKNKLILMEKNYEEIINNWNQNIENQKKVRKEVNEIKIKIQNEDILDEKEAIWINKIMEINSYIKKLNLNIEVLQDKIKLIEKDNTVVKEEIKLFKRIPKLPVDKEINKKIKEHGEEKENNNNEEEEEEEEDNDFNRNLKNIKMNILENKEEEINIKKENNIGICNENNCEFCVMIRNQLESFIQDYSNYVDNVEKKINFFFKNCKDDIKRIENKITEYQFKTLDEKEKIYNETYKIRDLERLNTKIIIKDEIEKFIKENKKTMEYNLIKSEWHPNENKMFQAKNIKELDIKLKNEFYNKNKLNVHTLLKKGLEGINSRMEEFWKELYARERLNEKNNQSQKKKGFEFYFKYQKKFLKNKYTEQVKKNEKNYYNRNRSKRLKAKGEWEKIIENGNELILFMNGFREIDDPLKKKIKLIWDKENNELIIKDEEDNFMDKYCSICLKKHDVSNICPDAIFMKNQNNLDWNRKESKENICMICGKPHCCWLIQKNGDIKNIFKCSLLRKWFVLCSIGNIEYKIMEKTYIISDEIDWKLKWNMFEKIIMARFEKEYLFQTINKNIWLKNGNLNKLEQEIKKQKIRNFKFDVNNIKLREIFKKIFNMTIQIDATDPLKVFWNDKNFKEKKIINGKLVQSMIKNFILNKIILKIIDLIEKNKEIITTPITNNDKMKYLWNQIINYNKLNWISSQDERNILEITQKDLYKYNIHSFNENERKFIQQQIEKIEKKLKIYHNNKQEWKIIDLIKTAPKIKPDNIEILSEDEFEFIEDKEQEKDLNNINNDINTNQELEDKEKKENIKENQEEVMEELFNEIENDNQNIKDNRRDNSNNTKKKKFKKEPRIDTKDEEILTRNKKF